MRYEASDTDVARSLHFQNLMQFQNGFHRQLIHSFINYIRTRTLVPKVDGSAFAKGFF